MPKFGTGKEQDEEKNSDISTGCLSGFCFTCFRFMFFRSKKKSKQQGKYHKEVLNAKISGMFYKFSDIYHAEIKCSDKLNRYRHDFNEIRNRIYAFQPDNLISNVNEISAGLNLSTSYFQHIYKQLFGVSVMSDIIRSRIEYACYLLSNNADSISEIAFRCGYENKEHFTRQFKEITGFTPRQYREKI